MSPGAGNAWGMTMRRTAVLLGAMLLFTLPAVADACQRSISKTAAERVVPAGNIDQRLLSQAVRGEVNYHRCRAGLPPVAGAGAGLSREVHGHSRWMAKRQTLSHKSTVRGRATLKQRFQAAGLNVRTGSENIGMVHRYRIDNKRFQVVDAAQCKFRLSDGQSLPAHSYASLARHIVGLWMQSPGHRRNILDPEARKVSTGVAFDPKAKFCGRFWLTQSFIG